MAAYPPEARTIATTARDIQAVEIGAPGVPVPARGSVRVADGRPLPEVAPKVVEADQAKADLPVCVAVGATRVLVDTPRAAEHLPTAVDVGERAPRVGHGVPCAKVSAARERAPARGEAAQDPYGSETDDERKTRNPERPT